MTNQRHPFARCKHSDSKLTRRQHYFRDLYAGREPFGRPVMRGTWEERTARKIKFKGGQR